MLLIVVTALAWLVVLVVHVLARRAQLLDRITAAGEHVTLALGAAGGVTASAASRTLSGVVVKYGVPGHTSRGLLKVAPGALQFPGDLGAVKLTREHVREESRGHLVDVEFSPDGIRAALKVSDGPDGDAALREAQDRTRDGLSFDIVDALIVGDTITSGRVVAIGQVGIPAYEDGRIDAIAAAMNGENMLTKTERARLNLLRAKSNRTTEESVELNTLAAKAGGPDAGEDLVDVPQAPAAPADGSSASQQQASPPAAAAAAPASQGTESVAASMQSVPGGAEVNGTSSTSAKPRGQAFSEFVQKFTEGLAERRSDFGAGQAAITAALSDITNTTHKGVIEPPAWSGELWSGLVYEPLFLDLFTSGDLTSWQGKGWRFTDKLAIADYAGDKAAIPSDTIATEAGTYEAARMAVGVDIDRKFFDFPNEGFVASLFEQVRESWTIKLDAKVAAYIAANMVSAKDVEPGGAALDPQTTLLKAAAAAVRALKRRRVGKASFVLVNDDDMFSLFDTAVKDVPAFLDLFDIDPKNFRSAPAAMVPVGTVVAGVKQAATVRTLPGSPIRVEAQNLVNAGVDDAFFGYWAIEEHHTSGIASAEFDPTFDPDA